MAEEGVLKKKEKNREMIQKHAKIASHKAVIDKLIMRKKAKLPKDFERIQAIEAEKQDHVLEVTMRMFRTVFVELKKNIPFEAHSALVQLQTLNGINMGFHYFSRKSSMHNTLLKRFPYETQKKIMKNDKMLEKKYRNPKCRKKFQRSTTPKPKTLKFFRHSGFRSARCKCSDGRAEGHAQDTKSYSTCWWLLKLFNCICIVLFST
jgi:hypothetical protein